MLYYEELHYEVLNLVVILWGTALWSIEFRCYIMKNYIMEYWDVIKVLFLFLSCPVCRYCQSPEPTVEHTCIECDSKEVFITFFYFLYENYICHNKSTIAKIHLWLTSSSMTYAIYQYILNVLRILKQLHSKGESYFKLYTLSISPSTHWYMQHSCLYMGL